MNASDRFFRLSALVLTALLLTSCGKSASPSVSPSGFPDPSAPLISPEPTDGGPSPEDFPVPSPVVPEIDWTPNPGGPVDRTTHRQSYTEGGTVVMDVSADYPKTSLDPVDAYYANALEDTAYRCDKLSGEARALKEKGALAGAYDYTESYTVELNAGGLLSVRRDISLDTGGELPAASVVCDTFRVSDGAMLSLGDFFTAPEEKYSERLLYSVRKYISENKGDLFGDAEAIAAEAFPYDTFCVTKNGISLFYPEMTIAPQSMGVIRIDVPWEVFGDLWRMP